jgi:hypothetical protein
MDTGFSYPWYHNVDEVFDAVLQVLQVHKVLLFSMCCVLTLLVRDSSFSIAILLRIVM